MNDMKCGFRRSTIRRHLNAKIDDWIKSITDELLAIDVAKHVIITGGSITSMLMGDKVNDYDIYFDDIAIAERVARYYVDQFNEINKQLDCENTKPCNPEVKREKITNCKGDEEDRVIIYIKSAGVAAEGQSTYRYFECHPGDFAEEFAESLTKAKDDKEKPKYRPVFMSQNAITLSDKIQLIIRFSGSPAAIHKNFDFVHATCWFDYGREDLVLPPAALEAMLSRTLVYNGSLYPVASIFRIKKFLQRGWRISAGQQLKIMWQLSELNLRDPVTLREQLTGVDQAYMYQLIHALEKADPEKINSAYVSTIIDRIFD